MAIVHWRETRTPIHDRDMPGINLEAGDSPHTRLFLGKCYWRAINCHWLMWHITSKNIINHCLSFSRLVDAGDMHDMRVEANVRLKNKPVLKSVCQTVCFLLIQSWNLLHDTVSEEVWKDLVPGIKCWIITLYPLTLHSKIWRRFSRAQYCKWKQNLWHGYNSQSSDLWQTCRELLLSSSSHL